MIHTFGYGTEVQQIEIPEENLYRELLANDTVEKNPQDADVRYSLEHPIASGRLKDLIRPGEKIAIVTSDVTRPMPTAKVMPALLEELGAGGADFNDITLVFALGSHRKQTEEEKRKLAGEFAYQRIRVADSDPDDCVRMGVTENGTPVDITRIVAEADRRIALGNIEFHYFAGYSGGVKAIMPGVSTPAAIQSNHKLMIRPEACAGRLEGNPVREDIEEAGRICPVDFILNVVLDEHKNIVKVVLENYGYQVFDLGKDVPVDIIVKTAVEKQIPLIGLSALMTTTLAAMEETIQALHACKHSCKIMIGGAVVSQEYADKVQADYYAKDAKASADIAKEVFG